MLTSSRKQKGHSLEKLVRKRLIEAFNLDPESIRIPVGSENGCDLKLSRAAKLKVPLKFECKNWEKFETIYKLYSQAEKHEGSEIPVLVIKSNYKEPLVILNLDYFITLMAKNV